MASRQVRNIEVLSVLCLFLLKGKCQDCNKCLVEGPGMVLKDSTVFPENDIIERIFFEETSSI